MILRIRQATRTSKPPLFVAALLLLAMLVSVFSPVNASTSPNDTEIGPITAVDSRIAGDEIRTRFVMDLDETVQLRAFTLNNPYRVVIDLPDVVFSLPPDQGTSGRGLISAYRFGNVAPGKSRIVLDLVGPVRIDRAFVLDPRAQQPARLVVDLVQTDDDAFARTIAEANPPGAWPTPNRADKADRLNRGQTIIPNEIAPKDRPIIVLDPGHGGIDPGAISKGGLREKDVVLKFAGVLKDTLAATGLIDVHLTREDDSFIPLSERVQIARDHAADLFISIHADSFRQSAVSGATVYTVSDRASDRDAAEIAERENASDIIAGLAAKTEDDAVSSILFDLVRRETKNLSIIYARSLVGEMRGTVRVNKNPHRFAGFRVLRAPDVPSVLVEIGYLSNRKDEAQMMSVEWQSKMSDAITEATLEFLRKSYPNLFSTPVAASQNVDTNAQ